MSNIREDWEKARRKIWERELRGYDEDACEQVPEESEREEMQYAPAADYCL